MLAQWSRRVCSVIALGVFLAGCAAEPTPTPAMSAFFPKHDSPLAASDAAVLEGPLVFADGCLWVEPSAGPRLLILWPANTTLGTINSHPVVLGPETMLLVETGEVARIGGRITDLATAEQLVGGTKFPRACSGDAFWVASSVGRSPSQ